LRIADWKAQRQGRWWFLAAAPLIVVIGNGEEVLPVILNAGTKQPASPSAA